MKKLFKVLIIFSVLTTFFTGCDNFLNSNDDFKTLMETDIDYARAPLVNIFVGHNNDDYGTVGTGVINYSFTAKVGYAFDVSFVLKASAGNFIGWNAYTKYDPDVPANCVLADPSYVEFLDNSQGKLTAKVKILKEPKTQIRLVPEVTAFPVMEICMPTELLGIRPVPVTFNPAQPLKALTPEQDYSVIATTSIYYGFDENPEKCWKVYRKDILGNEIELSEEDKNKIKIYKNEGTLLSSGRSQSSINITVDPEFSGKFYVSPILYAYPSMKIVVDDLYSSLVKISHSGDVSMAQGTPYAITLQTDPSIGFSGWKLCTKSNDNFKEIKEIFPANEKTTTDYNHFEPYSDEYITVSSPEYTVTNSGKASGKVNASILVTLNKEMDDLDYSYYLLPQFFTYPVVNIKAPEIYGSSGHFSLSGPGYLDTDTVRMMMGESNEYIITYKTTEDYSFADTQWIVYETSDPKTNLLDKKDSRIDINKVSFSTDDSGTSTSSISVILKHNFGTDLNIQPVVVKKPSMNIAFAENTPDGINLSLGRNTITSGNNVDSKEIKIITGESYTATVNIPKGNSFEGWRLVQVTTSNDKKNWIVESTASTTNISNNGNLAFSSDEVAAEASNYIRVTNAKYEFAQDGRNAGTTKATVDITMNKELNGFSLYLIPIVKSVPEISFVPVNSDHGTLSPSDSRTLYTDSKINLNFKSTKLATVGTEIWKINQWDPVKKAYSINYSANVGYTSEDLTSALNNDELKNKDIIIYNNDTEGEVQPNSIGEYITSKSAVLYVNKMPETNLQLSVTPEIYNTIKFVPGEYFESSEYDSAVIIPAGKIFNYTIKTKTGYKFSSIGTPENGTNTRIPEPNKKTDYNGVSTVTGTIKSEKNNGDAVVVTPEATALKKVTFGKPSLESSQYYATTPEYAGTTIPPAGDYIYQIEGNSISIKFETTGEYTYEGFAAGSSKFSDVSETANDKTSFVLSTGTLAQAKSNAKSARIIIHDIIETDLTDSQGQAKKRITGTLTVVTAGSALGVRPLVKEKPSFSVSIDAEKGSVSPAVQKAILINEDYDIRFVSTSGYGFEKWSVTNNGTAVPVLTLDEAKNDASGNPFVVNLDTVPELSGNYTLSKIQTALGTNKTNLFGILYNASKVESQSTEGVETATAKFRIIQDVNSTIVVSPVTYKHSYFTLKLSNSSDGRFTPATRTMLKAGKDYDFEYIFNGNVFSVYDYSVTGSGGQQALTVSSISDWEAYSGNNFVIYGEKISVDENTGIVTRHGKIRLMKELTDGIEITITPCVFPHPKVSISSTPDDVSKLQFNNIISTTGSIDLRNVIDHDLVHNKSYSISATAVNGKAIYADPAKMWKVSDTEGNDLINNIQSACCTDGSYDGLISSYDIVLYNCRLESAGNNLYKASADIIVKMDQGNTYIIEPQVYTIPEFDFGSPVTTVGSNKKGTCEVNDAVVQGKKKILVGQEYKFTYTAENGNHISSFGLYENTNTEKKVFNETTTSYTDSNIKITGISFGSDKESVSGTLTLLEPVSGYYFKCQTTPIDLTPKLNIDSAKTHVTYRKIHYKDETSGQVNYSLTDGDEFGSINESETFDNAKAISRGYQGNVSTDVTPGYPIAEQGSIKFFIDAEGVTSNEIIYTPSKVKITERLFYLHPGMIFDYSKAHDYSEFDVIQTGGLQLYDVDGNYIADNKYLNAPINFEETTTIAAASLSGYNLNNNTITGNISYTNKIPYGGIHQYIVSVIDNEGHESNKFIVYLDVPRTPQTLAYKDYLPDENFQGLTDDGLVIRWDAESYKQGTIPLDNNRRLVYSAEYDGGSYNTSTVECEIEYSNTGTFHNYITCLMYYPLNTEFTYATYLTDSNGYATPVQYSMNFTSPIVNTGDLVVRDSETFKLYYITFNLYTKNKNRLEPMAIIVNTNGKYGTENNRIIGAGLYDVGDYPFANLNVYTKRWWGGTSANTVSFDGRTQFDTWKTHPEYYGSDSKTYGDVLFTEPNFPALFKATHYGDVYKTKTGVLVSGWYLPGSDEMYGVRIKSVLDKINKTLTAIDAQPFEYNAGYWSAEFATEGRNIVTKTPSKSTISNSTSASDFASPTEIHHVRAVFDFTDIAEPWPYN